MFEISQKWRQTSSEISQRRSDSRVRSTYPSSTADTHRLFNICIRLIVIKERISPIRITVLLIPNRPPALITRAVPSALPSCARRLYALLRTIVGYLSAQQFPTFTVPACPGSRRSLRRTRLFRIILRSRTRLVAHRFAVRWRNVGRGIGWCGCIQYSWVGVTNSTVCAQQLSLFARFIRAEFVFFVGETTVIAFAFEAPGCAASTISLTALRRCFSTIRQLLLWTFKQSSVESETQ